MTSWKKGILDRESKETSKEKKCEQSCLFIVTSAQVQKHNCVVLQVGLSEDYDNELERLIRGSQTLNCPNAAGKMGL